MKQNDDNSAPEAGPVVEVSDLRKTFRGLKAVKGVSFTIEKGDVFGLIGPNGAGKTTTIRMLATLLQPTGGDARVCGRSIWRDKPWIRSHIGYMPDVAGFYQDLKVEEYLGFFAAAFRLPVSQREKTVNEILALVDLTTRRHSLVRYLSRGMIQRLEVGRTLIHSPVFLLLDEPASGLDPAARVELRELLRELHNMGKTILISSHILPELEQLCNKVAIMERGEILFSGGIADLRAITVREKRMRLRCDDAGAAMMQVSGIAGVVHPEISGDSVVFAYHSPNGNVNDLLRELLAAGAAIRGLTEEEQSLEEMYLTLTRNAKIPVPEAVAEDDADHSAGLQ